MPADNLAEELFVFEFDAGHVAEVGDAFVHFELFGEFGCLFVFGGVLAFQSSSKIHGHEPTGGVT